MNQPVPSGIRLRELAVVLLLALAVRGTALGVAWHRLAEDPDGYWELATHLQEHGTFGYANRAGEIRPTAYRPPLYPLLLAAGNLVPLSHAWVAALHLGLGASTVLLVYVAGCRWWDVGAGRIAALLIALDPILLNQSTLVMTETLAAALVMGIWCSVALAHRAERGAGRRVAWTVAGIGLGLAVLSRPTFLVWGAALGVALLAAPGQGAESPPHEQGRGWRRRLEAVALLGLAAAVVLMPWVLRNRSRFDRTLLTTTHGGYTLWLGNNAEFYDFLRTARWGDVWDSAEVDDLYNRILERFAHDELAADRWARQQALDTIADQPRMFALACAFRVSSLWGLIPHRTVDDESLGRRSARYAVGAWYGILFLFALCGLIRLRNRLGRPPWLTGLLLCLAFTAVHTIYWSNLRMRAPLMPVVCLVAAVGLSAQRSNAPVRGEEETE